MAGFMDNFGSMLQNPQFLMGMGLLNNQKSANPMQDAMMNMLQYQQMQRAFAPQQQMPGQQPMQQQMPPPQMPPPQMQQQMPPPQMMGQGQMPQIQGMGGGMGMRPPRGMGGFGGKMKSGLFG